MTDSNMNPKVVPAQTARGPSGSPLLTDAHWHGLEITRGIAPDVIRQRGYLSALQPADLIDRTFNKAQAQTAPALVIPLWNVHGQSCGWQMRPDKPRQFTDGRKGKYELPKGDHLILDVHPRVQPLLGDPHIPLWVTEGIPKGDALVTHGACAIALIGVRGIKGSNAHGGKVLLPDWDYIALNGREVLVVFDSDIYHKPEVDTALKALYAFLRHREAIPRLVHWPEEYRTTKWGVDDFLAQGHTLEDLLKIVPPQGPLPPRPPRFASNGTARPGDEPALPYSDYTNALAFVRDHGQHLRYCYPWKTWLVWTGTHWQRDTSGQVMQMAKTTVKRLAHQVEHLDEKAARALLDHVKTSLSTGKLKALVESAQSEPGMPVQPEAWDGDPWLLNCTNGTLDLRTGSLRPHAQADYITKCLTIAYDPEALCKRWDSFLWRIMGGSQEEDNSDMTVAELAQRQAADDRARSLITYLQRIIGYSLTGSTREQCFFLLHGPTKTGKSTFVGTTRRLLGPYAKHADMESFMHKDRQEVRNDIADLAGARYIVAVESAKDRRLNINLVKQITGGVDSLKARFLFEEYFEFRPQFKVFLATNNLPKVPAEDAAFWERVKRVPFVVQIPLGDREKDLEDQLLEELPGILAWAVQGCLEWQQLDALKEPQAVIDATQGYRDDMDDLQQFLTDVCLVGQDHYKISASALLKAYHQWSGQTTETAKALAQKLHDRGFTSKRGNTGMFWLKIGLPASTDSSV